MGVAHFKETLRPYFVKGVSYIFIVEIYVSVPLLADERHGLHNLDYPV